MLLAKFLYWYPGTCWLHLITKSEIEFIKMGLVSIDNEVVLPVGTLNFISNKTKGFFTSIKHDFYHIDYENLFLILFHQ